MFAAYRRIGIGAHALKGTSRGKVTPLTEAAAAGDTPARLRHGTRTGAFPHIPIQQLNQTGVDTILGR
jgi:hypothetical protein